MNINYNYNLKDLKKDITQVILIIRYNGKRIKIFPGISIETKSWDKKKQRVKHQYNNSFEINNELEKFLNEISVSYNEYFKKNPDSILIDIRKIENDKKVKSKLKSSTRLGFFDLFQKYLDYLENNKGYGTYKKIRTVRNKLFEYSKRNKISIDVNTINQNFFDGFITYLIEEEGNTNNTINKKIDNYKMFMTWAERRGFHKNKDYKNIEKLPAFENEVIYLTEEELENLEKLDLSSNKHLEMNRDLFLFGCYTGQRFSDYGSFDYDEVKDGFWVRNQVKGGGRSIVRIPLSTKAKIILEKYRETGLPKISIQRINENIKVISEKAGINSPLKLFKKSGNKNTYETCMKFKKISTHTARKTFVTLSLKKNMSPEAIMKITGHKSMKEFQKYLNVIDSWVNDQFTRAWG